jgi:hypothetical protein
MAVRIPVYDHFISPGFITHCLIDRLYYAVEASSRYVPSEHVEIAWDRLEGKHLTAWSYAAAGHYREIADLRTDIDDRCPRLYGLSPELCRVLFVGPRAVFRPTVLRAWQIKWLSV